MHLDASPSLKNCFLLPPKSWCPSLVCGTGLRNLTHLLLSLFRNSLCLKKYSNKTSIETPNEKWLHGFFVCQKYGKFWSFSVKDFMKYESLISEERQGWWPWVIDKEVLDQMHIKKIKIVNSLWAKEISNVANFVLL